MLCGENVYGQKEVKREKENLLCGECCKISHSMRTAWNYEPKHYGKKKMWHNIKNDIDIKCEICHTTDVDILTVHHMDGDRKNNDLNNLQLLCYNCHFKIHHTGCMAIKGYIAKMEGVRNAITKRQE